MIGFVLESEEKKLPKPIPENQNSKKKIVKKQQIKLSGLKSTWNEGVNAFFKGCYSGSTFNLGRPLKTLMSCGLPNKDIILTTSTLKAKIKKHELSYKDLKDLDKSIKAPLCVFKSDNVKNAFNVITDRKKGDDLLCVSIHTDVKHQRILITKIASVHPRNNRQLKFWNEKGLLLFEDTKKTIKHFGNSGFNCQKRNNVDGLDTKVQKKKTNTKKAANSVIGSSLNCSKSDTLNGSFTVKVKKDSNAQNSDTIKLKDWKPKTSIKPLPTDLGTFMGGYERNRYALVLRGEKGAGKSRFLCQVLNLFACKKLKSLFLSLEMSPESELFGNYLSYIKGNAKGYVDISANDSVEKLEEYCKQYDVIAVDSWGKLKGSDQWLLDHLIKKYPKVIWLVIFQSTTAGTARGGLGSEYDGSLVVQVAKGGNAQCEKNRYNSCDLVYNVFDQKLVKEESNENKKE